MPFKKKEIKKVLSQEEYERRIAELQKELEELKKVKVEDNKPKKDEIWKPKDRDMYYYLCSDYRVALTINYGGSTVDSGFMECANFYKTKEEAEYQANVQKYTNLFRKYVEEHSEPLDWNSGTYKFYVFYSFWSNQIKIDYNYSSKIQGVIYASSEKVLEDAIEFVGKENVIKYVLGVD